MGVEKVSSVLKVLIFQDKDVIALNYQETNRKAKILWLAGLTTGIPLLITCAISAMLMIYHRIDDGSAMGAAIAKPFKVMIYNVFDNTRFLELFWTYAPIPNPFVIKDPQNIYFALVYIGLLTAISMIGAARKLQKELKSVDAQIRRQLIAESIRGERTRTIKEVRATVPVDTDSFWPSLHKYYVAPIIVGVVTALIVRVLFEG